MKIFGHKMFEIEYLETIATRVFKSITPDIKMVIKRAIEERLRSNPALFGKPLRGSLRQHYRLRIEDYRVIYRIDFGTNIVTSIAIGHRRTIYDDYK